MEEREQSRIEHNMFDDADSNFLIALEGLRNLRPQLMRAGEYCEQQYLTNDEKHIITGNLREYAVKALVNVVDHLSTVADKLNLCIDQEASRINSSDLQIMSLQQRVVSMRTYMEQDAARQQQQPKAGQRMVKQYRVTDATIEAAFAAAQLSIEMPREMFDFDKGSGSEAFHQPAVLSSRSSYPKPGRSGPLEAPWRASSATTYQGAPDAPSTSSTTQAASLTSSSTSTPWIKRRPSVDLQRVQSFGGAPREVESPELQVATLDTRLNKGGSKLRRLLSKVLSK